MDRLEIEKLVEGQRSYYRSAATLSVKFRRGMLKRLYRAIKLYEGDIAAALEADLGKCAFEGYMCEVGMALSEISYLIKHLNSYTRQRRVKTPLAQFPSISYRKPTPYGCTLIMSPWNYPFLLTVDPLAAAIAAGNTAIVKPSAYAPKTAEVIEKIITECFEPRQVAVVKGGRAENTALLDQKFDLIFFTGSKEVGKEVLRRAAEHLTPVILELGGKSPCIVDSSADIALAAKRIVFGKFLNCGQTCVAPDYVLAEACVAEGLAEEIKRQIAHQLGTSPLDSPDYGRIVNEKHFDRLLSLIDGDKLILGGEANREQLKIAPTLLYGVKATDAVMGEEIFGPILPILSFNSIGEVIDGLKAAEKPLALYIFSKNKENIGRVTTEVSFGGGCINDVIIHLATSEMGFGGVGESGMGEYHGKAGFDAFTHYKSIVKKSNLIDLPMRYRPYKDRLYERLLRFFLK